MRLVLPFGVVLGIAAAILASVLPPYTRFLVGELAVFVIIAAGINIIMGVAGIFSVASPAFLALGATGTAALMIHGVPVLPAIIVMIVIGWLLGWLLGLVALRLSGIYLAIVSLAFLQAMQTVLNQGGSFTGGGYGLVVPPTTLPLLGSLTVDSVSEMSVLLAVVVCSVCFAVVKSRVGRGWIAMKEHPEAAELQGTSLLTMRTKAFALGSGIITLAGGLYALILGITNPSSYGADTAVTHLSYVVVGGMTPSVVGPLAGPAILFLLPQFFKSLGEYLSLFYAGLMLVVLAAAPRGVAGLVDGARQWWRARPAGRWRSRQAPTAGRLARD